MQKKLVLTVYNADGEVIFSKDPASFEHVQSSLIMFDEVGTEIYLAIRPIEASNSNS